MRALSFVCVFSVLTGPAFAQPLDRDADIRGLPPEVRGEILCERNGDLSVPENRENLLAEVPDRYVAWLRAGMSGGLGSGADKTGLGMGAQVEASVGLLNPFYLGGGFRWLSATQIHVDAVAGFNFRTYGTKWIKAGVSTSGSVVHAWSSNCQVRRTDYAIVAGGKYLLRTAEVGPYLPIIEGPEPGQPLVGTAHMTALQLGIQHVERRSARSPLGGWSLSLLYDPINVGYGAQGSYQAQGLLLFFPGPKAVYTGFSGGLLYSQNYGRIPFWFTIDLGAAFEI